MKVRMTRTPDRSFGCNLVEGQTGTVADGVGRALVAAGIADCLDAPPKELKAVPVKAVISERKTDEISGSDAPLKVKKKSRTESAKK